MSQRSVPRDPKVDIVGEDANIEHRTLKRSVDQNKTMRSDVYLDSMYCKVDRHIVGVLEAPNDSSLFSSALSELVNHKLRLSSNKLSRQSSAVAPRNDEDGSCESLDESKELIINHLLPDEEELLSGIVDDIGHLSNTSDDLEDFDVFTYGGGIELKEDDHLQAGQGDMGYTWGIDQNPPRSIQSTNHASRVHYTPRSPTHDMVGNASSHENFRAFNGFPTPVRTLSVGRDYGLSKASQSFPEVQLDNRGIPCFCPHYPQVPRHNVVNIMPHNSLDSITRIADEIHLNVPEMGLNAHARELSDAVFGHSVASKSNSYQHQNITSLCLPNSPSLFNDNHPHHLGRLLGSPGAPHLMMNLVSPMHHLQVGSAPVMKASLWDRQQIYTGESDEASGYQMGTVRAVGIPGFSASLLLETSSPSSFYHVHGTSVEMSKNVRVPLHQQMSHMSHERSAMNSLPASFGSPSERARSRRSETHLSHADRKHYELNIDHILQGEDSRTTLMIKNIPNRYTSKMLLATIDEHHRGKYDFIYLPIDFKNKCNMGYAFINMIDPLQIVAFHQTFEGRKWEKFNSEKVASLAYARIQGKAALIVHFQNSSLMNEDKRCRPILFHTAGPNAGDQEPFPVGTSFRAKPGRQQAVGSEADR